MNWNTAWRGFLVALIPAVALHELTHAAIAHPWADVSLEWRDEIPWYLQPALRVHITDWHPDTPAWIMITTYLAPLLVGYSLAGLTLIALGLGLHLTLSLELTLAIALNWIWYTAASAGDLQPVMLAARAAREYPGGDPHGT